MLISSSFITKEVVKLWTDHCFGLDYECLNPSMQGADAGSLDWVAIVGIN